MNRETFRQNILELIRRTSAFLPPDVENVINLQRKLETSGSKADFALELVAQNIGWRRPDRCPSARTRERSISTSRPLRASISSTSKSFARMR